MNARAAISPMMSVPTRDDANLAVKHVQHLFARTLSAWAVDVLRLRQSGDGDLMWNDHRTTQQWKKAA